MAMLVSPLPGASRKHLRDALRLLHAKVSNLRSGSPDGSYAWLVSYLDWVNEAARTLRTQVHGRDIDRLVLTRRYELLLSLTGRAYKEPVFRGTEIVLQPQPRVVDPVLNDLLGTELEERAAAFEEAATVLNRRIERWSRLGTFVVLDTSVYLTHPDKLEDLDIAALIQAREDVHVLVPMVVVDELDGLKQRGDDHGRWRAGHSLAVLNQILPNPDAEGQLRAADLSPLQSGGIPRGTVNVELLFDPPGHVRLPINDDEIIDRALTAQSLAERPVTLITYDSGQSFRARAAGLSVQRLPMPIENEPEPERRRRGRRQDPNPTPQTRTNEPQGRAQGHAGAAGDSGGPAC